MQIFVSNHFLKIIIKLMVMTYWQLQAAFAMKINITPNSG